LSAFGWIRQAVALTALNIRTLPERRASSLVAVFGIAAVVAVFAGILSMATGFQQTVTSAGSPNTIIVIRSGATTELNSGFTFEQTRLITEAPQVLRDGDKTLSSSELYVIVDVTKKSTNTSVNVALRGVEPAAYAVRDGVRIVAGRNFEPGRYEIVVGRAAQAQFANLEIGSKLHLGQTEWTIVGVFEAGGSVFESELWCDVRVLQPAYRRGNTFQSVRLRLAPGQSLDSYAATLKAEPRLNVSVSRENEFYAQQSEATTTFIRAIGYPIAILMAIGAVFGALNTMYASVSARAREIATLRAIGFGPFAVAVATLFESTMLALIGGILGGTFAYLAFNGLTASTLDQSFSQVVFNFAVTGELLVEGIVAALIIGAIGGMFPAVRAARIPVVDALREM
jgi:putative ABC transport system permease protein